MFFLTLGAVTVVFEVSEGLLMEYEVSVVLAAECVIPAACIPCPGDALCIEPVADSGQRLCWQETCRIGLWRVRRVDCVELIDGIAILRDFAVPDHASVVGFLGHDGLWCVGKYGRAGTDQPEMVEERAPERGHKEIVGERELLGELPELSLAPIVVPMTIPPAFEIAAN